MRIPIADAILAELIGEQLETRIASGGAFTAYSITRLLRQQQPQLDIPHPQVRAWVHKYMGHMVSGGLYTASQRGFGKDMALVYEPALVALVPTMPTSLN